MSKKKMISKLIRKGKFYHVHEGSNKGHPGMVFWKNDNRNLYLLITTDSDYGSHRTKLKHPTDSRVKISFVQNRPMLAKRKNIGSEYFHMRFHKDDKIIIRIVSRRDFRETPDIRSKDRRYMKKLKKKPRY